MEVQYYGGNCVKLTTKKASVVIDDTLTELGLKAVTKPGDIALFTTAHEPVEGAKLTIDQPGEYEVSEVSVQGVGAQAHVDESGKAVTMFRLIADDVRVAILGHIYSDLDDSQLEALGTIDVLIVPVGGNGYTLDPVGAAKVVKKIDPKVVIPTHYEDAKVKYPVPQQPLEEALKTLALGEPERVAKYKVKGGELGETTKVVVLERQ